ncbi:efflux RND transporter periplasmic adaptor subunit [Pseudoramibacter faecis]|uniref:efflux RND transporter periplasmic adaptor subunit n=1 Tax=Pseudoramibacter faecis TaxID=3108534 RepID=UPI002E787C1E|nr:HlyD family efflux transporter periplasmic adaptor subunit [Pseudoramibacter sp. HA2172]
MFLKSKKFPHIQIIPKNKKWLIIFPLILLAAIIGGHTFYLKQHPKLTSVKATSLRRTNLTRTVTADGYVASQTTRQVSDTSGQQVQYIDVSLNNNVSRGTRLCTLYNAETRRTTGVYAPIAGTITHIGAVKGAPANGELFTIQNTGDLKVIMQIKQADIASVATGKAVTITAEGTNRQHYRGIVASISPAAEGSESIGNAATANSNNDTTGTAAKDSSATFEASANINRPIDGLRIGMKTHQEIIVATHQNVLSVPFDAITKNEKNADELFYATKKKDGTAVVHALPVTLGLQSDSHIEVQSDRLRDNMLIILNPAKLSDGQRVRIQH